MLMPAPAMIGITKVDFGSSLGDGIETVHESKSDNVHVEHDTVHEVED